MQGRLTIIRITIEIVESKDDESLDLKIRKMDPAILHLVNQLKMGDESIFGTQNGKTHKVSIHDIFYFEAVERRVFIYGETSVYEVSSKLYEIEEKYEGLGFVRVSKSVIVNVEKMKSIYPTMGKFKMMLTNGEEITVSRQYIRELKAALGIEA